MAAFFEDRHEAGRQLAKALFAYLERDDVIVLALPLGGVPVAFEVAQALHVPLDLLLVQKLSISQQDDLMLGALALPDICVFNHDTVRDHEIPDNTVDHLVALQHKKLLARNRKYRGNEPPPSLKDRVVIVVDDGMTTGSNMRAAISTIAQQQPYRIVVAVPVLSQQAYETVRPLCDDVVSVISPLHFYGVGQTFKDFTLVDDEEINLLLGQARHWGKGHVHFRSISETLKKHG